MKSRLFLTFILILNHLLIYAQGAGQQTDFLRSIGKMYAVVFVVVIIFLAIIFFMIRLDRKISKLEKQIHHVN